MMLRRHASWTYVAGVFGLLLLSHVAAGEVERLTGTEFVASFRAMKGRPVEIIDCRVAGTMSQFIRCETPNGAVSYTLEAESMRPADLAMLYETCPTGSARKSECRFSVSGTVRAGREPSIDGARLRPADQ